MPQTCLRPQHARARKIIDAEYEGAVNFMTPHRVKFGVIRWKPRTRPNSKIVFELSSGSGFRPWSTVWGVSIVRLRADGKTFRMLKLSDCFDSETEAMRYIDTLKSEGRRL